MAAPKSAMVAGSRCSGRASTKATITAVSTASDCLSSCQSSIDSTGFILITAASASGVALRSLPQRTWMMTACTAMITRMTGVRFVDEVVEGEADLRADQDVGRIADQGGGAADIGGEDLGEQVRIGRHFQRVADRERHRNDQQHRGDVVEQGRQYRGGDLQEEQDAGRMRLGELRRPHRQILEHAGAARDRHQDHHAGKQADGIEVDAVDRLFLVEHADQDHHAGADQRDDRAVDLLRHDGGVGDGQDGGRHPHRIQAEKDVRNRVRGHSRAPPNPRAPGLVTGLTHPAPFLLGRETPARQAGSQDAPVTAPQKYRHQT